MFQRCVTIAVLLIACIATGMSHAEEGSAARPPANDAELRRWLENMVWHHRYSHEEIALVIGRPVEQVAADLRRLAIRGDQPPAREKDAPLLVLPYPGGRHPRIGFLEGAVDPQRETKFSLFTPWKATDYVVVDVPEAIWWKEGAQRELLYLAHTHVPTVWSKQKVELPRLEWQIEKDDSLRLERKLPNGVVFGVSVAPSQEAVRMEMWLTNGTSEKLTGLAVQNCVMFKGAPTFAAQANDNKILAKPFIACRSQEANRYVITAWEPCGRVWANPPCPCMHSDPQFPDCAPGATVRLRGWLSFYEGADLTAELKRIRELGWLKP